MENLSFSNFSFFSFFWLQYPILMVGYIWQSCSFWILKITIISITVSHSMLHNSHINKEFQLMLPVGQTCIHCPVWSSLSLLLTALIIPPPPPDICCLASKTPHALAVPPASLALSSSWPQYWLFLISLPFKGESLSFPRASTFVLTALRHTTLTLTHFQPWVLTEFQTLYPAIYQQSSLECPTGPQI